MSEKTPKTNDRQLTPEGRKRRYVFPKDRIVVEAENPKEAEKKLKVKSKSK